MRGFDPCRPCSWPSYVEAHPHDDNSRSTQAQDPHTVQTGCGMPAWAADRRPQGGVPGCNPDVIATCQVRFLGDPPARGSVAQRQRTRLSTGEVAGSSPVRTAWMSLWRNRRAHRLPEPGVAGSSPARDTQSTLWRVSPRDGRGAGLETRWPAVLAAVRLCRSPRPDGGTGRRAGFRFRCPCGVRVRISVGVRGDVA
jgi:hypothetical protein